MRWPIRIQLLLPMLAIMVVAIILVSFLSAFLGANRARRVQQDNLHRVISTLNDPNFPLSDPVLRQMSSLSGAEFVFFDKGYRMKSSTIRLSNAEQKYLQQHIFQDSSSSERQPVIMLREQPYLSQRVTVKDRPPITPGGWLAVLYPEEYWATILWQAAYPAFAVGAAAIAAIVLITLLLAHRFVEPIRRLGDRAATIAEGNFEPLPVTQRNDEIRDLALSINRMAERLSRYENDIRRHEQMRTLGQLGAGLAHQLRNAATGGRMAIELHQLHCPAKTVLDESETLEVALRQLRLMESYLQRFLALGQTNPTPHEPLNLVSLVEDALDLVRPRSVHAGIELIYNEHSVPIPPDPLGKDPGVEAINITGDANALRQLFVNLLINAIEAISGSTVETKRIEVEINLSGDKMAVVIISDSGPGPAPQVAERIFEPFVTAKPEGTGLGLYVARQTVEKHCGNIHWSRSDEMTFFFIELPIC